MFSVSDTGRGIASTHLAHVFDRFWQAPGTERRGMGFGLAIVKGIVEAHGGRVWVQSSPAQGTTFFFTPSRQRKSKALPARPLSNKSWRITVAASVTTAHFSRENVEGPDSAFEPP